MKYGLLLVVVVMILTALVIPAQAGKPQPYPPPDFEIQAYPAPPTPLAPEIPATEDQLYAQDPDADPILGVPYVWGQFTVTTGGRGMRAIWVSIQGVGNISAESGTVCIRVIGTYEHMCKLLMFWEYIPRIDMSLFYSPFADYCGRWFEIENVYLHGTYGNWREPNSYYHDCMHLPVIPRT